MWSFNTPNIENKVTYTKFIEKKINCRLPDHLSNSDLFELVDTYQLMLTQELAPNTTKMNVASRMVDTFLRRQLLQKNLIVNLAEMISKRFNHGKIHY